MIPQLQSELVSTMQGAVSELGITISRVLESVDIANDTHRFICEYRYDGNTYMFITEVPTFKLELLSPVRKKFLVLKLLLTKISVLDDIREDIAEGLLPVNLLDTLDSIEAFKEEIKEWL